MKKNDFIKNILNDLQTTSKYLTEAYIFGEDEMEPEYNEVQGEMPHGEGRDVEGDSQEEIAMHAQEVIRHEPIIGKIRETAIEGLKKYADNPSSKIYEFMKKVFLEADKVLTDTGSKK